MAKKYEKFNRFEEVCHTIDLLNIDYDNNILAKVSEKLTLDEFKEIQNIIDALNFKFINLANKRGN